MTDIQEKLLKMFAWYHELCEKEGLTYYAVGGTVLGAIRHQGFIPWDDDIDVGMPREDYEKLKKLAQKQSRNAGYYIEIPGINKDYIYPYIKIYDTSTTLIEHTRNNIKRGIYIDVFPIDGIGNTMEESLRNERKVARALNVLLSRVCAIRKGRSLIKNIAISGLQIIPESLLNTQKLIFALETKCKRLQYEECKYVANLVGNWYEKEVMKKEWLGKATLEKFATIEIYCPEKAEEYLQRMYGDWRQLPPEEKRNSHHDYVYLNLNESYLA